MEKRQFDFALIAYKSAIETYNEISNRVSTRFNIILTIDIALAGFFVNAWVNEKIARENGTLLLPLIGFVISIFLYFQSAQDKYILKKEIQRINEIKDQIITDLNIFEFPCLFIPLDETDVLSYSNRPKKNFIFYSIFNWRSNLFSVTKIPVWISIVLIFLWIIIFIMNIRIFFP
jgi:hypothetical protein